MIPSATGLTALPALMIFTERAGNETPQVFSISDPNLSVYIGTNPTEYSVKAPNAAISFEHPTIVGVGISPLESGGYQVYPVQGSCVLYDGDGKSHPIADLSSGKTLQVFRASLREGLNTLIFGEGQGHAVTVRILVPPKKRAHALSTGTQLSFSTPYRQQLAQKMEIARQEEEREKRIQHAFDEAAKPATDEEIDEHNRRMIDQAVRMVGNKARLNVLEPHAPETLSFRMDFQTGKIVAIPDHLGAPLDPDYGPDGFIAQFQVSADGKLKLIKGPQMLRPQAAAAFHRILLQYKP